MRLYLIERLAVAGNTVFFKTGEKLTGGERMIFVAFLFQDLPDLQEFDFREILFTHSTLRLCKCVQVFTKCNQLNIFRAKQSTNFAL